jgi:hypothetical protein
MARDHHNDVVGLAENDAQAKPVYRPLSNIQVSVYLPGTTTLTTIYQARTGASQKSNPFTTVAGGVVEFWAEYGEYDIKFHDLNVPARIGDKTIGWNAINAGTGATPSNKIAADGGLPWTALDGVAVRQAVPIGAVIEWWRPASTVPVPAGYAICDGQSVGSAAHDFGTGGTVVLPDLRNVFILGANSSNADGSAGTTTPGAANAPGIRGTGGAHQKSFQHIHTVSAHSHGAATGTAGAHTHSVVVTGNTGGAVGSADGIGLAGGLAPHHHAITMGGAAASAGAHAHVIGSESPSTTSALSATEDIRPVYVGLLRIMKIKRN